MTGAAAPLAPTFRPIPSLLGAPIADIDEVRPGDICMLGLFEDHADATGFGARFAARQIRYASQGDAAAGLGLSSARLLDLGDLNVFPLERERNSAALMRQLVAIIGKGAVPVVVGGYFAMAPVMRAALKQVTGRTAIGLHLPAGDRLEHGVIGSDLVALTIDLASLTASVPGTMRPLARLRQAIETVAPGSIGAVHLMGLAPELDLCGRHDSDLGRHVLHLIVSHLSKAGA